MARQKTRAGALTPPEIFERVKEISGTQQDEVEGAIKKAQGLVKELASSAGADGDWFADRANMVGALAELHEMMPYLSYMLKSRDRRNDITVGYELTEEKLCVPDSHAYFIGGLCLAAQAINRPLTGYVRGFKGDGNYIYARPQSDPAELFKAFNDERRTQSARFNEAVLSTFGPMDD